MTERWMVRLALAATLMLGSFLASAAEGGTKLLQAGNDLGDRASLQRGAQLYMNYCSGCHALKYLRYSRMAQDLGLTEEEVMNNLNFTGSAIGDPIPVAMPKENAEKWFGKMPPDLSLISRQPATGLEQRAVCQRVHAQPAVGDAGPAACRARQARGAGHGPAGDRAQD
ncbi:hypothetical protein G6F22_019341 [Rhizopus arrhizus]|nr:hypothetical protein G6F22_019341 [Rhizopus arrhizus]KAG1175582.1 hypothetical protein G6F35_016553 [Rhizopus arrhizus]